MHTWDTEGYLTNADERGRPFVELVAPRARQPPMSTPSER